MKIKKVKFNVDKRLPRAFNNKYLQNVIGYIFLEKEARKEILENPDRYFDQDTIYQVIIELKLLNKIISDCDRILGGATLEDLHKKEEPQESPEQVG